jgi:hypothetical protein
MTSCSHWAGGGLKADLVYVGRRGLKWSDRVDAGHRGSKRGLQSRGSKRWVGNVSRSGGSMRSQCEPMVNRREGDADRWVGGGSTRDKAFSMGSTAAQSGRRRVREKEADDVHHRGSKSGRQQWGSHQRLLGFCGWLIPC